jgi:hypothetical protein
LGKFDFDEEFFNWTESSSSEATGKMLNEQRRLLVARVLKELLYLAELLQGPPAVHQLYVRCVGQFARRDVSWKVSGTDIICSIENRATSSGYMLHRLISIQPPLDEARFIET